MKLSLIFLLIAVSVQLFTDVEGKRRKKKGKLNYQGAVKGRICKDNFDDSNFSACAIDGDNAVTVNGTAEFCDNEDFTIIHPDSCGNCEPEKVCLMRAEKDKREVDNGKKTYICKFAMARCEKYEEDGTILSMDDYNEMRKGGRGSERGRKGGSGSSGKQGKRLKRCRHGLKRKICSNSFNASNLVACMNDSTTITDKTVLCANEDLTVVHMGECGNCERDNICKAKSKPKGSEDSNENYDYFCELSIAKCEKFRDDGSILCMKEYNEMRKGGRGSGRGSKGGRGSSRKQGGDKEEGGSV